MKPTDEQKRQFRAKHAAILKELQAAFDFPTTAERLPALGLIDEAVLIAQELPDDSDFRSMREWQIDRAITCEM